jgi:hypothetical protein
MSYYRNISYIDLLNILTKYTVSKYLDETELVKPFNKELWFSNPNKNKILHMWSLLSEHNTDQFRPNIPVSRLLLFTEDYDNIRCYLYIDRTQSINELIAIYKNGENIAPLLMILNDSAIYKQLIQHIEQDINTTILNDLL